MDRHLDKKSCISNRAVILVEKDEANGVVFVTNYNSSNNTVNKFIRLFDTNGKLGRMKLSKDGKHSKMVYVCDNSFIDIIDTNAMRVAFENLGVYVTTNKEDTAELE
ncbi:MAG: hypothetical protein IJ593_05885 [Lachnospiraceae bacterium]|nr:hypothetical protein [Lachnospiraceae bacterium]